MKVVRTGTQFEEFQNISFDGISLPIYCTAAVANTAIGTNYIDLTKGTLKVIIHRNGTEEIIINDNLKNLVMHFSMLNAQIEWARHHLFGAPASKITLVPAASGVKHQEVLPLNFDFGTTINIKGNERVTAQLTLNTGFFGANVDQENSYVQFDLNKSIGVEYFTPFYHSKVIEAGSTNFTCDLGNMVDEIFIINYNKDNFTPTVVSSLNLSSDKLVINDNFIEILAKVTNKYTSVTQMQHRIQNYPIHSGIELNNVSLALTLNASEVAASQNFILYRRVKTNEALLNRAASMDEKHRAQNIRAALTK
jgi:hypothetical protein